MRHAGWIAAALALAGCTVGPGRVDPPVPLPPARPPETIAAGDVPAQRLVPGVPAPARWWTVFGSAKLDTLVQATLARNNDLAVADATLRQTREQALAVAGGQGLQADLSYQAERARVSQALSAPLADPVDYLYTLHTAQITVAYPLDLFGAGRNKVRSARAAAAVAGWRLRAARTTAVAELVVAVIQHAGLDAQIEAQRQAIASNRELVVILQRRQALGDIGLADVVAQRTVLATAEASLPALERQRDHQSGLIASLTGIPAGSAPLALPSLDELRLPRDLPLALPATVVANRPDVQAAAAQMQGAAADLGTAIAARLPAVQLTGTAGGEATRITDLFATGNPFYTLIGAITQPLFHSGQLRHQERAARAALDGAEAQYRAAALQAFLDVDDAIAGLRTDAAQLDAAARSDQAARLSLTLTRRQVELGAIGTLGLLNASAAASQAAAQEIQARTARLTDTVALFQATGTPTDPDQETSDAPKGTGSR